MEFDGFFRIIMIIIIAITWPGVEIGRIFYSGCIAARWCSESSMFPLEFLFFWFLGTGIFYGGLIVAIYLIYRLYKKRKQCSSQTTS